MDRSVGFQTSISAPQPLPAPLTEAPTPPRRRARAVAPEPPLIRTPRSARRWVVELRSQSAPKNNKDANTNREDDTIIHDRDRPASFDGMASSEDCEGDNVQIKHLKGKIRFLEWQVEGKEKVIQQLREADQEQRDLLVKLSTRLSELNPTDPLLLSLPDASAVLALAAVPAQGEASGSRIKSTPSHRRRTSECDMKDVMAVKRVSMVKPTPSPALMQPMGWSGSGKDVGQIRRGGESIDALSPHRGQKVELFLPAHCYIVEEPVRGAIKTGVGSGTPEFYRNHFYSYQHVNLVCNHATMGPIAASVKEGTNRYRVLVRTKEGDTNTFIPLSAVSSSKKSSRWEKVVKAANPLLANTRLAQVEDCALNEKLLQLERDLIPKKFKFGVLYAKEDQRREEEMFCNGGGDEALEEFLSFLGDKVELDGFDGYSGGLDTKRGTTGTHSIHTKWRDNEIMFHVSTMLPFSEHDEQQLERKRHIGNDIVLLVFFDRNATMRPNVISSNFIHIIVGVQVGAVDKHGRPIDYIVSVAHKDSVDAFGPAIPSPPRFKLNIEFRDFLMAKMVNGELASYHSPRFKDKLSKTREAVLRDIYQTYTGR